MSALGKLPVGGFECRNGVPYLMNGRSNVNKLRRQGIAYLENAEYLVLSVDPLTESMPLKYHDLIHCISLYKIDSMIHAKELRYGNKVQTQHGEIITVQQILSNTLVYDTQIKVTQEMATVGKSYKTAYTTQVIEVVKEREFQEIDPIELTPKVLEKCGFRNYVREEWILKVGGSYIDFEFNTEGLRLKQPIPSQIRLRYLHQLQNFLFSMAGHELETNLA